MKTLGPYLTPYIEIKLKWVIRVKTIKLPEGNIGENFSELGVGKNFITEHKKHKL